MGCLYILIAKPGWTRSDLKLIKLNHEFKSVFIGISIMVLELILVDVR